LVVLQFEHIVGTSPSPILESALCPRAADELLVDRPLSVGVDVPDALPSALLERFEADEEDKSVLALRACAGTGGARIPPLDPDESEDDKGPSFIVCKLGDELDRCGGLGLCSSPDAGFMVVVVVDFAGPRIAVGFPWVGWIFATCVKGDAVALAFM
jgi:hypothetical protein